MAPPLEVSDATPARTALDAPPVVGPNAHGVAFDRTLYRSAQLPLDPTSGKLDGESSAAAQTRRCLRNLEAVCAAAGTSLSAELRVTLRLTDLSAMAEVNEAYGAFFGDHLPARIAIGVASLPRDARVVADAGVEIVDASG